jgi:hypothetical protein
MILTSDLRTGPIRTDSSGAKATEALESYAKTLTPREEKPRSEYRYSRYATVRFFELHRTYVGRRKREPPPDCESCVGVVAKAKVQVRRSSKIPVGRC